MTLYTENSDKWKTLADVDYFTQFVKAWIPLNAWYRNYYPDLRRDREAINEIKSRPNTVRNRLLSLLDSSGGEGISFRAYIAQLHYQLERKYIFNKGNRVTFTEVVVEENTHTLEQFSRNRCAYSAQRHIPSRPNKEIDISVHNSRSVCIFSFTQTNGFNREEVKTHRDFSNLSVNQRQILLDCYEQINPAKAINLLLYENRAYLEMDGALRFTSTQDLICKGVIEVLYTLRNVLFHGEIVPDSDTNKVYEPAYQILYMLIQAL